MRWGTPRGGDWSLHLRGDVGGFGIGTASDFSWQGQAVAACRLSEHTSLGIGCRYLSVDRERGSASSQRDVDLTLSGLLVGLEYRF